MTTEVYVRSLLLLVLFELEAISRPEDMDKAIKLLIPDLSERKTFYEQWRKISNDSCIPLSTLLCVFPEEMLNRFWHATANYRVQAV